MSTQPAPKDLFERWLDVFVYAPLGLALKVREDLPGLVSQGRQKAENRVQVARFVGQMAVSYGSKELTKRLAAPSNTAPPPVQPAATDDAAVHVDLPFSGYDELPASEIVQRLNRSTVEERRRVHTYESARRRRRTVLAKAEQLGV
jgi:hypothetical protein